VVVEEKVLQSGGRRLSRESMGGVKEGGGRVEVGGRLMGLKCPSGEGLG